MNDESPLQKHRYGLVYRRKTTNVDERINKILNKYCNGHNAEGRLVEQRENKS